MAKKKLTIAEVREIALKNYNRGGDVIVECWSDKDIKEWIDHSSGTKTALLRVITTFGNCYLNL